MVTRFRWDTQEHYIAGQWVVNQAGNNRSFEFKNHKVAKIECFVIARAPTMLPISTLKKTSYIKHKMVEQNSSNHNFFSLRIHPIIDIKNKFPWSPQQSILSSVVPCKTTFLIYFLPTRMAPISCGSIA